MSKKMKASAFSWGERAAAEQPPGNGVPALELELPDTCMSENTTLPQRLSTGFSRGVVN